MVAFGVHLEGQVAAQSLLIGCSPVVLVQLEIAVLRLGVSGAS